VRPKRRREDEDEKEKEEVERAHKRAARKTGGGGEGARAGSSSSAAAAAAPAAPALPLMMVPSKTLLVQGLPLDLAAAAAEGALRTLFGQFAGLREIRPVPARGLAFVEFDTEASSMPALQALHNFQLSPTHKLTVSFAK
jgi:RNA recognition motif-containing protein